MSDFEQAFAHFPAGNPTVGIDPAELRPILDGFPAEVQGWVAEAINNVPGDHPHRNRLIGETLGVSESVAMGLWHLVPHQDA